MLPPTNAWIRSIRICRSESLCAAFQLVQLVCPSGTFDGAATPLARATGRFVSGGCAVAPPRGGAPVSGSVGGVRPGDWVGWVLLSLLVVAGQRAGSASLLLPR